MGEVGVKRAMASLGEASVCLPHAHQGAHEVSAAAFCLEGVGGVAGAEPHGDAIAESDLLGAPPRAVEADRTHRPLQRKAARLVEGGQGVGHADQCDGTDVTRG